MWELEIIMKVVSSQHSVFSRNDVLRFYWLLTTI
jgi:hypothetical protein